MLYFHFLSVLCILKIFFESSLTHRLFRSILLNFQVFRDFPIVTDFLFDSFVIRNVLYDFISFKFVEVCIMVQDMVSLNVLWALEDKKVYSVIGQRILHMSNGT